MNGNRRYYDEKNIKLLKVELCFPLMHKNVNCTYLDILNYLKRFDYDLFSISKIKYKKRNKISPKSSAEEALLLSQYNLNIAKANKEATEQRVKEIKSPASDQNSLMNIAYSAYMGGNMAPKMMQAAKAYSCLLYTSPSPRDS